MSFELRRTRSLHADFKPWLEDDGWASASESENWYESDDSTLMPYTPRLAGTTRKVKKNVEEDNRIDLSFLYGSDDSKFLDGQEKNEKKRKRSKEKNLVENEHWLKNHPLRFFYLNQNVEKKTQQSGL